MTGLHQYHDEKVLLTALLNGNQEAYRYLVETLYSSLLSVAKSIVGPAIADEVVQESWLSVHKALPSFEGRSSLKTWITRIVANEAKRRAKRESKQSNLEDLDTESGAFIDRFDDSGHWSKPPQQWAYGSPGEILDEHQLKNCLEHTLKVLPDNQRAVFQMRELEDMDLADICNILSISDSNVRVLLHRAKLSLFATIDRFQETGEC